MKNFFQYNNFYKKEGDLVFKDVAYSRAPLGYFDELLDLLRKTPELDKKATDFAQSPWANLQQVGYRSAMQLFISFLYSQMDTTSLSGHTIQKCIRTLNNHSFGEFQIAEQNANNGIIRVYGSPEDKLYVERYGKATHPISAFTSGLVKALFDFSILDKSRVDEVLTESIGNISTIEQTRCEAEDSSFSEFLVSRI
ncbi:MAG: hypothetical protein ABUK01_02650 [Leptospirales bacterium]